MNARRITARIHLCNSNDNELGLYRRASSTVGCGLIDMA